MIGTAWWHTSTEAIYPTANSNASLTTKTSRQRLTGFAAGQVDEKQASDENSTTANPLVTVEKTTQSGSTITVTTTRPGVANAAVKTIQNGLLVSTTGYDGVTIGTGYDPLERESTHVDPRTGTTTTHYQNGTKLVSYIQDPLLNTVTSNGYDVAGRVIAIADANNKTKRIEYNTLDKVVHEWGEATYPVEYGYDATLGDRITMKTYRAGTTNWASTTWPTINSDTTPDWTRWNYDAATGLLSAKYDGLNLNVQTGQTTSTSKGMTYTYNSRGQVATRTWARNVTTTYQYYGDSGVTGDATGELYRLSYSDSTPTVTYTYTRAGKTLTVADGAGVNGSSTRTLNYGLASGAPVTELDSETLPDLYGTRVLTHKYDAVFRPSGIKVGSGYDSGSDLSTLFTFNGSTGRLDHVDASNSAQSSRTFTYGYTTNSSLVGNVTVGAYVTNKIYEPKRDLLTSVDTTYNGASQVRYDYVLYPDQRRYTSKQSGALFDFGGGTYYRYVYNDRGELTSAADYLGETPTPLGGTPDPSIQLPGRNFAFDFDNIGNRKSASRTGSVGGDTFQANAANQYSTRSNNYAHTAGTVGVASTTVSASGNNSAVVSSVGRQGRYWDAQVGQKGSCWASPDSSDT